MKFKVGETWRQGTGQERLIVAVDAPGDRPVVAAWVDHSGHTQINSYTSEGRSYLNGKLYCADLVAKVEPLWEAEIWVHSDGSVRTLLGTGDIDESGPRGWRRIRVREVR